MLLGKQLVPVFTARTQLPGARVLLIVHSVHTSVRQDPGRLQTNYVQKKSLLGPRVAPVCAVHLHSEARWPESEGQKGAVSQAQTLTWGNL